MNFAVYSSSVFLKQKTKCALRIKMPKESKKSLLSACSDGDHPYLRDFVARNRSQKHYDIYDNHRWGVLHHAVFSNNIDCVRTLLSTGKMKLRHQTFEGCTALLLAIDKPVSIEIIKLLADADPDTIDIPNNEHVFPMHIAVRQDRFDIVVVLVEAHRQKNTRICDHVDWDNESSLMLAARFSNLKMINYLLDNIDCNCEQLSHGQLNAFGLAAAFGRSHDTVQILDKLYPLTYGTNRSEMVLQPELLLPIFLCHRLQTNTMVIKWFVDKFYLSENNRHLELVRRLIDDDPTDKTETCGSILLALHSDIVHMRYLDEFLMATAFESIYADFYNIFRRNIDLFKAIAPVFMPKIECVQPPAIFQMFHHHFTTFDLATCDDRVVERQLAFLDQFQIHTNVGVDSILLSRKLLEYLVAPNTSVSACTRMFTLLLPFYTGGSSNQLKKKFISSISVIRQGSNIATQRTIISTLKEQSQSITLFDLCRTRTRDLVFQHQPEASNRTKLQLLMTLDLPIRLKNFLRYNETGYTFQT